MAKVKTKLPSTEDALNMEIDDLMTLTRSDLAKIVSRVTSTANKRIARMDKKGIKTTASARAKKGGKFSVAGKTQIQLIQEMQRAKQFLQSKTGGIKKAKSSLQKTRDTIKQRYGIGTEGITDQELLEMFSAMDKANINEEIRKIQSNTLLLMATNSIRNGITEEELKEKIKEFVQFLYEEHQDDSYGSQSPMSAVGNDVEDDVEGGIFR